MTSNGVCQTEPREKSPADGAGIIRLLADLPPEAILTEEALAKGIGKCQRSIKRAVVRGELPRPIRFFGEPSWTVRALRDHIDARMEAAKRNIQKAGRRIAALDA